MYNFHFNKVILIQTGVLDQIKIDKKEEDKMHAFIAHKSKVYLIKKMFHTRSVFFYLHCCHMQYIYTHTPYVNKAQ